MRPYQGRRGQSSFGVAATLRSNSKYCMYRISAMLRNISIRFPSMLVFSVVWRILNSAEAALWRRSWKCCRRERYCCVSDFVRNSAHGKMPKTQEGVINKYPPVCGPRIFHRRAEIRQILP